ncbi:MAG TPA: aminotransferase class III-fold pyridoxal phosphate-dependent enzyme [Candidatus Binatia bacterium]|nr:aminotransferase class III-fold pyridoxal phosphate-dependent enzyme [Candidatus Binatia bacterium]
MGEDRPGGPLVTRRPPLRGDELPEIRVPPPGPKSRASSRRLRRAEGAAIWGADPSPIVWSRARGSVVEDLDGNRYVDLTSGFGAATLGHASPEVARAVAAQARRLSQGLGDLHPHVAREKLVRKLSALGGALSRVLVTGTGSEAVELALKTAALATGRRRVVAFEGGYHGQSGAALEVTHFPRSPELLQPAGPPRAIPIPFPDPRHCGARTPCEACDLSCLDRGWERSVTPELRGSDPPGAVIVEPVQGRAGVIVPPPEFLARLSALAREAGMLVIYDEILTGAGRTGPFWAWKRSGAAAEPDLMTAGKGIGGGVAIGALFGKSQVMEVWSRHVSSSGESPYASTFYAHPLACAGALAALERLTSEEIASSREAIAGMLLDARPPLGFTIRALGAMAAIEPEDTRRSTTPSAEGGRRLAAPLDPDRTERSLYLPLLHRGVIAIPGGISSAAVSMYPAFTITPQQLAHAMDVVSSLS